VLDILNNTMPAVNYRQLGNSHKKKIRNAATELKFKTGSFNRTAKKLGQIRERKFVGELRKILRDSLSLIVPQWWLLKSESMSHSLHPQILQCRFLLDYWNVLTYFYLRMLFFLDRFTTSILLLDAEFFY